MRERAAFNADKQEIRHECLVALPNWVPPTGDEIRIALSMAGWTGEGFSRLIGVEGRTVRRWTSGDRNIPFAAWAVLCVQVGFGYIWE